MSYPGVDEGCILRETEAQLWSCAIVYALISIGGKKIFFFGVIEWSHLKIN
jgi:hypothetical protein